MFVSCRMVWHVLFDAQVLYMCEGACRCACETLGGKSVLVVLFACCVMG